MTSTLFAYPEQAAFERVLPKSKIYEHAKPSRAVRDRFVAEVEQIVWQYKLAPETINLPARPGVPEIQVFGITQKTEVLSEAVLRCIDKAIHFPIIFELTHNQRLKTVAAYKRPSDADASGWVVDLYFETEWKPAASRRIPLPVALDLAGLYERVLSLHIAFKQREGESLRELVERVRAIRLREKECGNLELLLKREVQFNRKVELNAQIRGIKSELKSLRA